MAIVRAIIQLERKSGIPRDRVVNTLHIGTPPGNPSAFNHTSILTAIQTWLTGMTNYYSPALGAGAVHRLKQYILNPGAPGALDDTTGSPVRDDPLILTPRVSIRGLPSEVALCVSHRANYGALTEETGLTRPRSRVRGRMYVGPLNEDCFGNESTSFEAIPTAAVVTAIADGFTTLHNDLHNAGLSLGIYSRASGTFVGTDAIWVDNAFDTVRSRGQRATARVNREAPAVVAPAA